MSISRQDVLHVASLARLDLDEAGLDTYAQQLTEILAYVAQLERIDTAGVPPTANAVALHNAFREDRRLSHLEPAKALANAPWAEDGGFIVPKIVG
jgi:aspartyl-tRNA(Asn)/glutamyl-tRNA(Gln) amidotransferase subunit C